MSLKDELAELQYELGQVDLLTRPSRSEPGMIEFLVVRLQAIKIKMDADHNHQRPHIHIDYGKEHHAASYAIDTGERLAGSLDTKYDRTVREWIAEKRAPLLQAWKQAQAGHYPENIISELRGGTLG